MSEFVSGARNSLEFWETKSFVSKRSAQPFADSDYLLASLSWSANNSKLAVVPQWGRKVAICDLQDDILTWSFLSHREGKEFTCGCLMSNSRFLLTGCSDSSVLLWDTKSRSISKTLEGHSAPVMCVAHNSADSIAVSGAQDGRILLHSLTHTPSPVTNLTKDTPFTQAINRLKFSHFEKAVVGSVSEDGSVSLWSVESQRLLTKLIPSHSGAATDLCFSPSNTLLLASVGSDGRIRCYDIQQRKSVTQISAPVVLSSVTILRDSSMLVAGGADGKLYVYDLRFVKTPLHVIEAHRDPVTCITQLWHKAFSPQRLSLVVLTWGKPGKLVLCNDVPGHKVNVWRSGTFPEKPQVGSVLPIATTDCRVTEPSTLGSLGNISQVQKTAVQEEFATPPNLHPTPGYVIAYEKFYQTFPRISTASNKRWSEKDWSSGRRSSPKGSSQHSPSKGTSPLKHDSRDMRAGNSVSATSTGANPGVPPSSTTAGTGLGVPPSSTKASGAHTRAAAMTAHTPFMGGGIRGLGQREVGPLSYVTPGPSYFPKDTSGIFSPLDAHMTTPLPGGWRGTLPSAPHTTLATSSSTPLPTAPHTTLPTAPFTTAPPPIEAHHLLKGFQLSEQTPPGHLTSGTSGIFSPLEDVPAEVLHSTVTTPPSCPPILTRPPLTVLESRGPESVTEEKREPCAEANVPDVPTLPVGGLSSSSTTAPVPPPHSAPPPLTSRSLATEGKGATRTTLTTPPEDREQVGASPLPGVQVEYFERFMRNFHEDLWYDIHRDFWGLAVDMFRQFFITQEQVAASFAALNDKVDRLTQRVEHLEEEVHQCMPKH